MPVFSLSIQYGNDKRSLYRKFPLFCRLLQENCSDGPHPDNSVSPGTLHPASDRLPHSFLLHFPGNWLYKPELPDGLLIMVTGILLTVRLGGVQIRHLGKAFKFMFQDEEDGHGEVTSFGALCTALSATIGTGNIAGVATAIAAGGPGALFWMVVAAFFGMATKYSEGLLSIKYRTIDQDGHVLGGPFYYIENGMGKKWKWLAKIFAFFGAGVGLFGIGTFTQVNSIASAVKNFFDPDMAHTVTVLGNDYSIATVIAGILLTVFVGLVVIGGIKRISKVSEVVVPFMAVLYVVLCLIIVFTNIKAVPGAFAEIAFEQCGRPYG